MIRYLGDKVSRYHMCLLCNGRGKAFHSTEAVRNHMCEKGHCFVEYEEQGQIELEEFYDFKPSWDAYYTKHGQPAAAATAADEGDSDWEDVDEDGDGMETEGASEGASGPKQALVTTEEGKIEGQMVALYKAGRTVEIEVRIPPVPPPPPRMRVLSNALARALALWGCQGRGCIRGKIKSVGLHSDPPPPPCPPAPRPAAAFTCTPV